MQEQQQTQPPEQISVKFEKVLMQVSRTMAAVGAVMFGVMMIISVIDVSGRYFFMRPLRGSTELVGLMLVIGGSWGMAYCQILHMHIRIDVLLTRFPKKVQSLLWIISSIVCAVVAALVSWQAYLKTNEYLATELGTRTDILGIPLWPFVVLMAIGFTWLCFVFLVELVQAITGVFKR
jgi:TRAP-type transport system small permease protein